MRAPMKICFSFPLEIALSDVAPLMVPVARQDGIDLVPHIGETVLLLTESLTGEVKVLGAGRFAGLAEMNSQPDRLGAVVTECEIFDLPLPLPDTRAVLHDHWRGIDDHLFTEIMGESAGGLAEEATPFEWAPNALQHLEQQVLEAYGNRCALTGASDDQSKLVATPIKAMAAGGAIRADNLVSFSESAADAFSHFHLTIGDNLEIIVDTSLIDPELLDVINASGRVIEASNREMRPATDVLVWHRRQFASRTGVG